MTKKERQRLAEWLLSRPRIDPEMRRALEEYQADPDGWIERTNREHALVIAKLDAELGNVTALVEGGGTLRATPPPTTPGHQRQHANK